MSQENYGHSQWIERVERSASSRVSLMPAKIAAENTSCLRVLQRVETRPMQILLEPKKK